MTKPDMQAVIADAKARLARGESLGGKPPKLSRAEKAFSLLVTAKHDCECENYESAIASAQEAIELMEKILKAKR